MKVDSRKGLGLPVATTAIAGAVLAVTVLAGTGFVPSRAALAQMAGTGEGRVTTESTSLAPVDGQQKAEQIRQPSGLGEIEAQAGGSLTPTVIKKAAPKPVAIAPSEPGAPAPAAPSGDGWSSAKASWYGPGWIGSTMASGAVLQRDSMIVAHKTLPFGTRIEFAFNGNTCVAVVMDRGPYISGRVFDFGPGTAAALGFDGVHTVQYRILSQ